MTYTHRLRTLEGRTPQNRREVSDQTWTADSQPSEEELETTYGPITLEFTTRKKTGYEFHKPHTTTTYLLTITNDGTS